MARAKKFTLPLDTVIEVVVTNGATVKKKEMKYSEALNLKKIKGWRYEFYQVGFCTKKATEENI